MARGWRRGAEVVLARSGAASLIERRTLPATFVLAYHNIVPTGEDVVGDMSVHLEQKAFGEQLDFLLEGREIVSLEEALDPELASSSRCRIAVTFDDAYAGTMSAGVEEVTKRGLPATVFVPPGLLGTEGFWWDRLAARDGSGLAPDVRDHALQALQGKSDRIFDWARSEKLPLNDLPMHARPVEADALTERDLPGRVSLGAHTWGHPNLARLDEAEAIEEMRRSRSWLAARSDHFVDWLAYPYGLVNDRTVAAAEGVFEGAFLVSGGSAVRRGQPSRGRYQLPRLSMPRGLSLEGLALRLSGLLA